MPQREQVVASAPAAIAVAGDTTDISGKGGTLTLGIEGPLPAQAGGLRAYARVVPAEGGATAIRVVGADEFTADTFFGASRLLEVAAYAKNPDIALTLNTVIPPSCGLGGAAAQLVALLSALDAYFGRVAGHNARPPEEAAEIVQRATLRPGQVHGYQKPYGATFGGARYFGFSRKLTGLWGKGVGGIQDEPYALVSESRNAQWESLGARILLAVPQDLSLVSGEVNAELAERYREGDPATVQTMDRKTFVSQLAHQRLVNGDSAGFWLLVDADTNIMEQWGLISEAHRALMHVAKEHGAYASKPASTGGAVIVFCPADHLESIREALQPLADEVYLAQVAGGARLEASWPFSD